MVASLAVFVIIVVMACQAIVVLSQQSQPKQMILWKSLKANRRLLLRQTSQARSTPTPLAFRPYSKSPSSFASSRLLYQNSTLLSSSSTFRKESTSFQKNLYRSFWSWRGGDDRKWSWRGGGAEAAEDDEEDPNDITSETTAAKETSANSKQPVLSPTAYPVSVCTAQGFRSYMEDEFFLSLDGDFAAVFDGHGGQAVSRYLRKNLYANVQAFLPVFTPQVPPMTTTSKNTEPHYIPESDTEDNTTESTSTTATSIESPLKRLSPSVEDYEKAIELALDKVDREVQRISHWSYQGSTAVAIWLHEERIPSDGDTCDGDRTQRTIVAANVGDSRAVLCRNNTAWELTRDHKPNDPYETARIVQSGGDVIWCGETNTIGEPIAGRGIYRVNGNLALSRAIGDRSERPHVTAEPETISAPVIEDQDQFIVLATDGLWDVFESEDAVEYVLSLEREGHEHKKIATLMVEEALRRGTYDNITVVIIWLDRNK